MPEIGDELAAGRALHELAISCWTLPDTTSRAWAGSGRAPVSLPDGPCESGHSRGAIRNGGRRPSGTRCGRQPKPRRRHRGTAAR
ncbi:hypothetical protein [Streptomyces sp. NPDC101165]|uniref:hypothetical protein n=1 Tax=Streptomyces sp. NPDC101165 TaxID=3366119 RepID=UPI00380E53B0